MQKNVEFTKDANSVKDVMVMSTMSSKKNKFTHRKGTISQQIQKVKAGSKYVLIMNLLKTLYNLFWRKLCQFLKN